MYISDSTKYLSSKFGESRTFNVILKIDKGSISETQLEKNLFELLPTNVWFSSEAII